MEKALKIKCEGVTLSLDYFWLRDHCRCQLCYNESNANRISNILEIPDDISINKYKIEREKLMIDCKCYKSVVLQVCDATFHRGRRSHFGI